MSRGRDIKELLPFIVAGIATGAVYGLIGTGLVLTYKTAGIFNFGHGATATAAAYIFYWLNVSLHLSWEAAAALSIVVFGAASGLVMERLGRVLTTRPVVYKVVGTIGLIVMVQGAATVAYGVDPRSFPQYLPGANNVWHAFGISIQYSQVIITAVGVIAVSALYVFFRVSRTGLAMRAVVDDPDLLALRATEPIRVRRIAWIIGSTFAALSGVLIAPLIGLQTVGLTLLVVQAFGAAAIGAFSSLPVAFIGALVVGVTADLSTKYVLQISWLSGVPATLPFVFLLVVLVVLPRRKLMPKLGVEIPSKPQYKGPPLLRGLAGLVAVALLAIVPNFAGNGLVYFSQALCVMVVVLSLGLLVKTSGQVSLCHATFMAIGACAFSQFKVDLGLPWLIAVVLGALVVVPVGAVLALPAIRLSGLFLALATFGFGVMVSQLFYPLNFLFGFAASGRPMPKPSFAHSDRSFYFVLLLFLVVTAAVMIAIHESRLGRLLRGLSDSPRAVSTLGLSLTVTRVIVFCISAFFAALGGILYGTTFGSVSVSDPTFSYLYSLVLIATLIIAPFREPWYVLPAAIGAALPAVWSSANAPYWLDIIFGASAIVVASAGGPPVMNAKLADLLTRTFTVSPRRHDAPEHLGLATHDSHRPLLAAPGLRRAPSARPAAEGAPGLEVANLSVRFGGLVAVDDLSMVAPMGRITGLIGPNGAGKTTTFNSCSGLNRPTHGRILLHGEDVSRKSPAERARGGLGRTFQRMDLCDTLTVAENVFLGREAGQAGAQVGRQFAASPRQFHATQRAAEEAIELCGITHLAGQQAGLLSTGERRLVELARSLAGPFDVLLLDEPSSGLDRSETAAFGTLLRTIVHERGCSILLVEHDVGLVMSTCAYIYVLDFGRLLFEGSPDEVSSSATVRNAYLGEDDADQSGVRQPASASLQEG